MKYIAFLLIIILLITACGKKDIMEEYTPPIQEEVEEEVEEEPEIILIEDREEDIQVTEIDSVTIEPKCVYGENGGEIYFKLNSIPKNTFVQVREHGEKFRTIHDMGNIEEDYLTFTICERCSKADFNLLPDKNYVLRMGFEQNTHTEYSNDHLINTKANTTFTEKVCSSKIKVVAWAIKE